MTIATASTTTFTSRISNLRMRDFIYDIDEGRIFITGYRGAGGNVIVPAVIGGLPVEAIGSGAFYNCTSLTSIILGNGYTRIESNAFEGCTNLTSIN